MLLLLLYICSWFWWRYWIWMSSIVFVHLQAASWLVCFWCGWWICLLFHGCMKDYNWSFDPEWTPSSAPSWSFGAGCFCIIMNVCMYQISLSVDKIMILPVHVTSAGTFADDPQAKIYRLVIYVAYIIGDI
jgi:hypothetical protein